MILNTQWTDRPQTSQYRLVRDEETDVAHEIRRIARLTDAWLMAQEQAQPNPATVRRAERHLHNAIKESSLYGKILSFAGLNLWVDDRTAQGAVMSQESVNL